MITLYLRKANGKGDRLHLNPQAKIQELIENIHKTLAFSNGQNDIEIFFKGERLNDKKDHTLGDCMITANSIIHVISKESQQKEENEDITVKLVLQEKLLSYKIKRKDTIGTLKLTICQDLDIKHEDDLTLVYLGSELDNGKTAEQYQFSKEVFISGSVAISLVNLIHKKTYSSLDKESASEESEGIPKIVRENLASAIKRVKKAESMNVEANVDPSKSKNVFASVQLNRIDQKVEQSKNQSQLNQSQISEEKSQEIENDPKPDPIEWQKPKMTLQSLSKPWYGSQKVIETQSIVDDEEDQPLIECSLELVRTDHLREYVLDCRKENTFEDAAAFLAKLQKLPEDKIRLLINFEDLTRSGISNRSSRGLIQNCPLSPQIKKQRSTSSFQSKQLLKTFQNKFDGMKMAVVDYATRLKKKELSFQYEIFIQI